MEKKLSNERILGIREADRAQTIQEGTSDKGVFSPNSNTHAGKKHSIMPGVRSSTDMSEMKSAIQPELSTMKLSVISAIQGQSPSLKFHAKLL